MTKFFTAPNHQIIITCGLCKHHTLLGIANLIVVYGHNKISNDARASEQQQRAEVTIQISSIHKSLDFTNNHIVERAGVPLEPFITACQTRGNPTPYLAPRD
jgi:hypothetical protein